MVSSFAPLPSGAPRESFSPGGYNFKRQTTQENTIHIPDEFLRLIPKSDLHVHLDGSMRLDTLIEIAQEKVRLFVCARETRGEARTHTFVSNSEHQRALALEFRLSVRSVTLRRRILVYSALLRG